jgi:hypothetical protein
MVRCRSPLILASVVAVAAFALLAAGCGGGGSAGVASVASSTNAATTTQNVTTTAKRGTLASAFAFARCMRSHGIPGWPDPNSSGVFENKAKLRSLGVSVSRVRALEDGPCNIPLPSPQAYTITPADRADYLKAAACMRSHGFPDFPDPTFANNNVQTNVPSTIDQDAPTFKNAAETCTKLIPAGLPYSRSSHS